MASFTPHTEAEVKQMLAAAGAPDMEALFKDIAPKLRAKSFDIPAGMAEMEIEKYFTALSLKNNVSTACFAGGGYYDHYIPAAVDALSGRPEFFTAYTPYQPEASQGTLQAIFEYQSMVSRLTGLPYANASLYDGGTALYEAVAMAVRQTNRLKIVVDKGVNPLFRSIIKTYMINLETEIIEADLNGIESDMPKLTSLINNETAAVVVQNPNFFGSLADYSALFASAKSSGAASIMCFNPVSLAVLKSPAETGADIAVAEGQSLGMPLSFGGPYLGIMAASKEYLRKMPGRIVGETVDKEGKRAFVLTLQAREQHIKREKATSNICSNQALCALRAAIYLSLLGREGLREAAVNSAANAAYLKEKISGAGCAEVIKAGNFNEFTIKLACDEAKVMERMRDKGILAGVPASLFYPDKKHLLIVSTTEKRTKAEMDAYAEALKEAAK